MSFYLMVLGIIVVLKGRKRNGFTKIVYEGVWVRVLGLFVLLLGILVGMATIRIISEEVTLILWFLILIFGGIISFVVEKKNKPSKK